MGEAFFEEEFGVQFAGRKAQLEILLSGGEAFGVHGAQPAENGVERGGLRLAAGGGLAGDGFKAPGGGGAVVFGEADAGIEGFELNEQAVLRGGVGRRGRMGAGELAGGLHGGVGLGEAAQLELQAGEIVERTKAKGVRWEVFAKMGEDFLGAIGTAGVFFEAAEGEPGLGLTAGFIRSGGPAAQLGEVGRGILLVEIFEPGKGLGQVLVPGMALDQEFQGVLRRLEPLLIEAGLRPAPMADHQQPFAQAIGIGQGSLEHFLGQRGLAGGKPQTAKQIRVFLGGVGVAGL